MKTKLKSAMTDAMRARDKSRLEILRRLLSAIQYEEVAQLVNDISDEQILAVLKRELKKSREELDFAEQASRKDLSDKVLNEIEIIEEFLPSQLNREQLATIIRNFVRSQEHPNLGAIMKSLKENYSGQYDGKLASEVVQSVLAEAN